MTDSITVPKVQAHKCPDSPPLVMVTAYDAPSAKAVAAAGADILLVGDSVGMVVLGYEDTISVTIEDMVHHTAAVARARAQFKDELEHSPLIVADMPWMSYHISIEDTLKNAARLIKAGASAVKMEGGTKQRVNMIEALLSGEIPVMGHLGLTPQSSNTKGGFKVQAKTAELAQELAREAKALEHAGCFAVVLEGIPAQVAGLITRHLQIPTIGIGAGIECDGQVLVFHDLLGYGTDFSPKFVRKYAETGDEAKKAIARFADDVRKGRFPSKEESYRLSESEAELLGLDGSAPR